jgi:hypothetical protein
MRRSRPRPRRPSAPLLIALLALFVALGGPAHAERLINGAKIKRDSIASKQVKDRSLKERDLERGAVRSLRATPNGAVTGSKLAPAAVTARALAPGSVLSDAVADNSLTAADLAANSVGTEEIGDNAVGQSEIRGNGVAAAEIADNSIDGGEIIDGGLSMRDIARGTGTFRWPIGPVKAHQCELASVPVADIDIAGDVVLVSPVSAWPQKLVYIVNGINDPHAFRVAACNEGDVDQPPIDATFNYAVLGN